MSSKSYKKSATKDQVMSHNVNKKRTTEDENFVKKDNEKKFQKEDEKQKKKKINWEEEKEIIKKYLSERYPLSHQKPKWDVPKTAFQNVVSWRSVRHRRY